VRSILITGLRAGREAHHGRINDQDAPNPEVDCSPVTRKAMGGDALRMGRLDCVIVATRGALRQTASVCKAELDNHVNLKVTGRSTLLHTIRLAFSREHTFDFFHIRPYTYPVRMDVVVSKCGMNRRRCLACRMVGIVNQRAEVDWAFSNESQPLIGNGGSQMRMAGDEAQID
jgi:hypothetical protein